MTTIVPGHSIGSGVRIGPADGDDLLIREGVDIISTDDSAISSTTAADVRVDVAGWVHGYHSGIALAITEGVADYLVNVTQTGRITSSFSNGIRLWGDMDTHEGSASINNAGSIEAEGIALNVLYLDSININNSGHLTSTSITDAQAYTIFASANNIHIVNSGTISNASIESGSAFGTGAINILSGYGRLAGDLLSVLNTGLISSPLDAISSNNGTDEITNTGVIEGNLLLGLGEDVYGNDDQLINDGQIFGNIYLGAGEDTLLGELGEIAGTINAGSGDDLVKSGLRDDIIIGGAGADEMWGGAGVDTASYEGSADGVRISLTNGTGRFGDAQGDRLYEIENLIGSGRRDTLMGSAEQNEIAGGNADDIIRGLGGNDILFGENGDDTISGGSGDDIISGDRHQDKLTGGTGEDIFAYLNILDSGPAQSERDNITDFTQGQDLIDLTELGDLFFGGTAFSGTAGEIIHYHVAGGTRTVVEIDTDGDSVADFGILLSNAAHTMTAADFLFV